MNSRRCCCVVVFHCCCEEAVTGARSSVNHEHATRDACLLTRSLAPSAPKSSEQIGMHAESTPNAKGNYTYGRSFMCRRLEGSNPERKTSVLLYFVPAVLPLLSKPKCRVLNHMIRSEKTTGWKTEFCTRTAYKLRLVDACTHRCQQVPAGRCGRILH